MTQNDQTTSDLLDFEPAGKSLPELIERAEALEARQAAEQARLAELQQERSELADAFEEGRRALRAGTAELADLRSLSDDTDLLAGVAADVERDLAALAEKLAEIEAERARLEGYERMADAAEAAQAAEGEYERCFREMWELLRETAPRFLDASERLREASADFRDTGLSLGLPSPDKYVETVTGEDVKTGLVSASPRTIPVVADTFEQVSGLLAGRGHDPKAALAVVRRGHRLGNRPGSVTREVLNESLWGGGGRSTLPDDPVADLLLLAMIELTGGNREARRLQQHHALLSKPHPMDVAEDERRRDGGDYAW